MCVLSWHYLPFLHLQSIANLFVTILIRAHLPCILVPLILDHTTFTIIFLSQMPYRSMLLDKFLLLICPVLFTTTLIFCQFHFQCFCCQMHFSDYKVFLQFLTFHFLFLGYIFWILLFFTFKLCYAILFLYQNVCNKSLYH